MLTPEHAAAVPRPIPPLEVCVGNVRLSPACAELFSALAAAQAELADPIKDSRAQIQTRSGGSYSYSYVDLAGALRHARPILGSHGLSVTQWPAVHGDRLRMTTLIAHASGQWMASDLEVAIPPADRMNPLQAVGSVISYARRYAFLAATGLAADDDDGGVGAVETKRRAPTPAIQPVEPAPDLDDVLTSIAGAESLEDLKGAAALASRLIDAAAKTIARAAYAARKEILTAEQDPPAPTEARSPDPVAEILLGIGRAQTPDELDAWTEEARTAGIDDAEMGRVDEAIETRRASLSAA
jgi:hypothetical protein